MRKYLFFALSIFNIFQNTVIAAEQINQPLNQALKQPGNEPNFMSVFFALIVVILLIYITGLIYSKLNLFGAKAVQEQLKNYDLSRVVVISTTQLGQNKNLHVIEIENKRYLIGATPNSINLIKELGKGKDKLEKTENEQLEQEENLDNAIEVLYGEEQKKISQELDKVKDFNIHKKYL